MHSKAPEDDKIVIITSNCTKNSTSTISTNSYNKVDENNYCHVLSIEDDSIYIKNDKE